MLFMHCRAWTSCSCIDLHEQGIFTYTTSLKYFNIYFWKMWHLRVAPLQQILNSNGVRICDCAHLLTIPFNPVFQVSTVRSWGVQEVSPLSNLSLPHSFSFTTGSYLHCRVLFRSRISVVRRFQVAGLASYQHFVGLASTHITPPWRQIPKWSLLAEMA